MRKLFGVIGLALLLSACGQVESEAQVRSVDDLIEQVRVDAEHKPNQSDTEKNRRAYRNVLQSIADGENDLSTLIYCEGVFEQGGAASCLTAPNSIVKVGALETKSDANGTVIIGFDRDAPAQETIKVTTADGKIYTKTLAITPRKFGVQRIDGLPPSQVSNYSKAQIVRINSSSARKKKGFASRETHMGFKDGFILPVEGIKTSDFGNQRILNGVPKRPHYGVDIAAPVGTPIYAPADGTVSLADDDLYFEGAMVLLDHGQGLISMYLHMSDISVEPGQKVKRGDKLGEVGAKGRTTGPHLCWRLKWRNRHLDPELLTRWPSRE